jgi:hypothetical protein
MEQCEQIRESFRRFPCAECKRLLAGTEVYFSEGDDLSMLCYRCWYEIYGRHRDLSDTDE